MKRWPGGDLDRKNDRNWVKIGPFWMEKRPVKAQSRGESIGPHFSGLKMNKNNEKYRETHGETLKMKIDLDRKNQVFHRRSDRNRVGIGPFGVRKIAGRPGRRGENFASARSG